MLAAGASIDVVARRLHHRNAALTLAVYDHPSGEERSAGASVMALLQWLPEAMASSFGE
jgi:hypothetical protein